MAIALGKGRLAGTAGERTVGGAVRGRRGVSVLAMIVSFHVLYPVLRRNTVLIMKALNFPGSW